MPESLRKQPLYAIGWCIKVVDRLVETHTRGYNIFHEITGIGRSELISWLWVGAPAFAFYKRMLQSADAWESRKGFYATTPENARHLCSTWLELWIKKAPPEAVHYLTDCLIRLRIQEQ